jgi:hypothetical protein
MTEFHAEIRERVQQALESLEVARRSDDDYLVEVRVGELESLAHLAGAHGLHVPELAEYVSEERAAS